MTQHSTHTQTGRIASSPVSVQWKSPAGGRSVSLLLVLTLLSFVGLVPATVEAQDDGETGVLRLFLDESKIIDQDTQAKNLKIQGLKRLSVTNPRVADVVIVGTDEIRVDARSSGRTSMYIWDQGGRRRVEIVVIDRRDDLAAIIQEAVNLPEVVVEVVNGATILRGWVDNAADRQQATEIARVYSTRIVDLLQVKGQFSFSPEQQIRDLINLPEVKVTVVTQAPDPAAQTTGVQLQPTISAIFLEGFVDDQRDAARAEAIALAVGRGVPVQNFIEVVSPIQVMIQAHILELSKSATTIFGFNWGTTQVTGAAGGPLTVPVQPPAQSVRFLENVFNSPHGEGTFFGARVDETNAFPWEFENINRLDPLFLAINWAIQNSKGRVLANPKVVTRSGSKAEIQVGGEFPFPQNAGLGATSTAFKAFGIRLAIEPEVDHKGNINTAININVSTPDFGRAQNIGGIAVPPLTNRTTQSEVSVKDGEHIVVSGLLSELNSKSFDKTPYLHRLPVLGNLFKSKNYRDDRQEVMVIITPKILAPANQTAQLANAAASDEPGTPAEDVKVAAGGKVGGFPKKYRQELVRVKPEDKPHKPEDSSQWALQDNTGAQEEVLIPASMPDPVRTSREQTSRERMTTLLQGLKSNQDFHAGVKEAYKEMEPGQSQYDSPIKFFSNREIDWEHGGAAGHAKVKAKAPTPEVGDTMLAAPSIPSMDEIDAEDEDEEEQRPLFQQRAPAASKAKLSQTATVKLGASESRLVQDLEAQFRGDAADPDEEESAASFAAGM